MILLSRIWTGNQEGCRDNLQRPVEKLPYFGCPNGKIGLVSIIVLSIKYRRKKPIIFAIISNTINDAFKRGQKIMERMRNNRLFHGILLFTVAGEFLLPWILKHYDSGYDSKTMVMSALGSPQSPVRHIYNGWLIWLGCFMLFTAVVYFFLAKEKFPALSVLLLISIGGFAIGAGLLSGIFSVNETKDVVTAASKIHGAGAAAGFMALLFFPLLNGILAFKQRDTAFFAVSIAAFILAVVFFSLFIAGDKEALKNTLLSWEGLWERAALFCMYIPFICRSVRVFIS